MVASGSGAASAAPVHASGASRGDDLTRILGIGEKIARVLVENGVDTFEKVAMMSQDDAERIEEKLGPAFRGKISSGNWRDQALELAAAQPPQMSEHPADRATFEVQPFDEALDFVEDEPAEEPPPPNPAPPTSTSASELDMLREQIAAQQKQIEALLKMATAAGGDAPRPQRRPSMPVRLARTMLPASEGGQRRRLNKNRKFSEIIGNDPSLPPGVMYQQVVEEDGQRRVAYFAGDGIQRFFSDGDELDIDLSDVEPPHPITVETVNFRGWLDGQVEYPLAIVLAAMKERLGFEGRTVKEAKEELHRIIRRNR